MTMMPEVGSKRSYDDEYAAGGESPKRTKTGRVELRLLLVGRYCGALIGKGGETIRKIREEHAVTIHGLNSHTNERVLSVNGTRDNCMNCVKEVLSYCAEGPYPAITQRKCPIEMNILLNADTVGSIIGKGGTKIKEITDETDAKVKVYPDSLPNSNERVVALGADDIDRVIAALNSIIDILVKFPSRMNTIFYDPTNIASGVPPVSEMNQMGMGHDNQMDTGHMGMGRGNQRGMGRGNRMGMDVGDKMGAGADKNMSAGMGPGYQNYENYQHGYGGMGYQQHYNDVDQVAAILIANRGIGQTYGTEENPDFSQAPTRTEITVSNEMCSSIIGKAGSNIRMIRTQSGARIQTTQTEKGSEEDRVITITGTQEQIQIAEQLMQQCHRREPPRRLARKRKNRETVQEASAPAEEKTSTPAEEMAVIE